MEEKRGLLTYFTGIARLILFIILLAIITFFVVRWVRARQDTKAAQQAAQGQNTQKDVTTKTGAEKPPTNSQTQPNSEKPATNHSAPSVEVPGGIADGGSPSRGNQKVPNAGIEVSIMLTALMMSVSTYSFVKFIDSRSLVAKNSRL